VSADNWVLGGNGITTSNATTVQASIDLFKAGVHSLEPVKTLPELRRQTLVCLDHITEQGIATGCWAIQDIQEGGAGRLLLEGYVRVPCDSVGTLLQERLAGAIVGAAEDQMNLGEALGGSRGLVDVVSAKVSGVVDDLLNGAGRKILVTEGCVFVNFVLFIGS
jgi:hypothetical protein